MRSSNLVIEGLPEDNKKPLNAQIGETIRVAIQDFSDAKIKSAYRVGKYEAKKKDYHSNTKAQW